MRLTSWDSQPALIAMRNEKKLIALLRDLVSVLSEEANRNPAFAARLDDVLGVLRKPSLRTRSKRAPGKPVPLPDVHAEWGRRDEGDFRIWLRGQPTLVMRELIRRLALDPTRRRVKWKNSEKLAGYITDGLCSRYSRGASFMGRSAEDQGSKQAPGDLP